VIVSGNGIKIVQESSGDPKLSSPNSCGMEAFALCLDSKEKFDHNDEREKTGTLQQKGLKDCT
jgi:hypothetical protein